MTSEHMSALSAGIGALNLRKVMKNTTLQEGDAWRGFKYAIGMDPGPKKKALDPPKKKEPTAVVKASPTGGSSYFNKTRNKKYLAQLDAAAGK